MKPVLHRKPQRLAELEIEQLVERCLRHDQQAWSEFLRRYIPLIKRSIKTTLRRSGFPEYEDIDVIDEIWVRIFEKLYKDNKLELCVNLAGIDDWLFTISMNQTYDWLKNKTRSGQIVIWKGNREEPDTLFTNDFLEDLLSDQETIERLKDTLAELSKIPNKKIMWALRLCIIAEEPLTDKEIDALSSEFNRYGVGEVKQKIADILQRLYERIERKQKAGEMADKLWHDLRKLEHKLNQISNPNKDIPKEEIDSINDKIEQKDMRRQELLNEAKQLCRPSNTEIADLIGLPDNQAQQVSTFLGRAREQIRRVLREKSFCV